MAQVEYKVGDKIDVSKALLPISREPHADYKVGTLFVVIAQGVNSAPVGTVIAMSDNDGTRCPYFQTPTRSDASIYWDYLAELPANGKVAKAPKPSVTSTMTVYSDGVEVNEDQVRFDGKTMTREEAKKTVARYQEVLRRPIAVVPVATKVVKKTTKVTKKVTKK